MTPPWYDGWDCAALGHLFEMGCADCVVCGRPEVEPDERATVWDAVAERYTRTPVSE